MDAGIENQIGELVQKAMHAPRALHLHYDWRLDLAGRFRLFPWFNANDGDESRVSR